MCGRFTLATPPEIVAEFFGLGELPSLAPRYNFAPTQEIPCVLMAPESGRRELRGIRWGLVPPGAKDAKVGNVMINARAETVATKPAFRKAFRERRCLVAADGFYEWKKLGQFKQPYYIRMKENVPLAFAGLWERAVVGGQPLETCTIITGEPNDLVRELHDRMPVMLDRSAFAEWLDPGNHDTAALQRLLQPFPAERMRAYPVSPRVNKPDKDDADCIKPVESQETLELWRNAE